MGLGLSLAIPLVGMGQSLTIGGFFLGFNRVIDSHSFQQRVCRAAAGLQPVLFEMLEDQGQAVDRDGLSAHFQRAFRRGVAAGTTRTDCYRFTAVSGPRSLTRFSLGSRGGEGIDFGRDPFSDDPHGLLVGLIRVTRRAMASVGTVAKDVAYDERDTHSAAVLFGPPFCAQLGAAVHGNRGMLLGKTSLADLARQEQRQAQRYRLLRAQALQNPPSCQAGDGALGNLLPATRIMIPIFETASAMTIPSNLKLLFGHLDHLDGEFLDDSPSFFVSAVAVPKSAPRCRFITS